MRAMILFAGGGGSTLGMEQAGFRTFSVDSEEHCISQLRLNGFAAAQVDLSQPSEREQLYDEEADVVWMSPPCQMYSAASTGVGVNGFPWGADVVTHCRPSTVIVENVKGAPWAEWKASIARLGYYTDYFELNAADFGVPQSRRRHFLVGNRTGVAMRPAPTCSSWVTLGEALPWTRWLLGDFTERARDALRSAGYHVYTDKGGDRPDLLARPAPTVTCQEMRGTRANGATGWRYHGGPDRLSDALFSAVRVRRASVEDCSTIQGFPSDFRWHGSTEEIYTMIGNAVPPAIAREIGLRCATDLRRGIRGAAPAGPAGVRPLPPFAP